MHRLWIVLILISVPLVYCCAVNVTKLGSAAQRATIECAAIPLVWIWFMVVPISKNPNTGDFEYDEKFTVL